MKAPPAAPTTNDSDLFLFSYKRLVTKNLAEGVGGLHTDANTEPASPDGGGKGGLGERAVRGFPPILRARRHGNGKGKERAKSGGVSCRRRSAGHNTAFRGCGVAWQHDNKPRCPVPCP